MLKSSTLRLTAFISIALFSAVAGFSQQNVVVMRNDGYGKASLGEELISDTDCGTAKGCFREPKGCEVDKCKFFVSWSGQEDRVDFELVGALPDDSQWVALCLATDKAMGNSSCIDCIASNNSAFIQMSYNTDGLANEVLSDPQLGLVDKSQSAKLIDGRLECKFSRWISVVSKAPDAGRVFTLSGEYYLLLANGPVDDDQVTKMEHRLGQAKIAPNAVNFQNSGVNLMGALNRDLINDKGCGESKGCFREPSGCEVDKCKFFVSWSGQKDRVDFELVGALPDDSQWLALCLATDKVMGNSSCIDCIASGDRAIIQMSYNTDGLANEVLSDPQLGLVDKSQSAKLIDGRLECKFSRWKSVVSKAPDAGRVFTLSGEYYLLLANGPVDDDQVTKMEHRLGQVKIAPNAVNFQDSGVNDMGTHNGDLIDDKGCGVSKGCFRVPDGCAVEKCKYFVSWSGRADRVNFELVAAMADDSKWAALGIARTNMMANSSVVDCIVQNGSAYIQMSYNNDTPANELLSNPQLGLVDKSQSAKLIDGRLECKFSRWISVDAKEPEASRVFTLSGEYYLLLANGPVNANGIKLAHHKGHVEVSPNAVSFQDNGDNISDRGCGVSKGCFRVPDGCAVEKCKYFVSWSGRTDRVDFELVAALPDNSKWAALGIARTKEMANSSVTDCIVKGDGAYIQMSYNNDDPDNVLLSNPQLGLVDKSQSAKLIDGRLECKFSRWISVDAKEPDAGRVFTLSGEYYLLLANGPVDAKGIKLQHKKGQVEMSLTAVNFQQNTSANGTTDEAMPMLIKAHVILMSSAWIVSAAVGAMIGLHFRSVSHDRYGGVTMWLWLHRGLMILAVCATTAGFVVVIIHKGKLTFDGFHHIIGFVVIIIAGINPLVAFCRPRTGANIKATMRWTHAILGLLVHFGAMVAIFFGVRMPEVGMPDYVQWIVLGFLGFTLLIDALFLVMKRSLDSRVGYDYALIGQAEETKTRNTCCAWFTFVLFVYLLAALALAGLLMFFILA